MSLPDRRWFDDGHEEVRSEDFLASPKSPERIPHPAELPDAWYASYGPQLSVFCGESSSPEIVFGRDDRTQVVDTSRFPWSAICSLRITAANGSSWSGTGWIAGNGLVVTAGHCLYIHNAGGWVREIEIMPGRNIAPHVEFGVHRSSAFRCVRGWIERKDTRFDYGAILLPLGFPLLQSTGWFDAVALSDAELLGATLHIAGYPGDKPSGTQWEHSNECQAVTSGTIFYRIDTAGGQSGAPVWIEGDKRSVIGIHTNGGPHANSATRITGEILRNLERWRRGE